MNILVEPQTKTKSCTSTHLLHGLFPSLHILKVIKLIQQYRTVLKTADIWCQKEWGTRNWNGKFLV